MIDFKKTELAKRIELYFGIDFTPKLATNGSVGYDLFACIEQPVIVNPGEIVKIPTGIHMDLQTLPIDNEPSDTVKFALAGFLFSRSSSSLQLTNAVGVIDTDYQGEIKCKYQNITNETVIVEVGEKFAQLILLPVIITSLNLVYKFDYKTERGEGGFGSTGK